MTDPTVSAQLEVAWDEADMTHRTLEAALDDAQHSALHSTFTAAIDRILRFNKQTMHSIEALLTDLRRHLSQTQP